MLVTDEEQIRAMKVVELKAQLAEAGLPQTGKKDELIERLLEHIQTLNPSAPSQSASTAKPLQSTPVMASQPVAPVATPSAVEQDDEIARRAARAARFGIPLDEETRRLQRMDRFGMSSSAATTLEAKISKALPDSKKHKSHGSGGKKTGKGIVGGVEIDVEKLRERQARFGVVESKTLAQAEMDEAKARRLARFGNSGGA